MRFLTPLLIGGLLLSGCATVSSDCATLFNYPAHIQEQAAEELAGLPPESALARLVADYGVVRAEARACRINN